MSEVGNRNLTTVTGMHAPEAQNMCLKDRFEQEE